MHIALERRFKANYTDYLPERGKSTEETKEILSEEFQYIEEVQVEKAGLAIGKLNGQSVREYLRNHRVRMREELAKDMEEDKLFNATPYGLLFFSKETCGAAGLGLVDYELKFYPSLFELNVFEDTAVFFGERLKGGVEMVRAKVENKKSDFIFLDQNLMLMFEEGW